MTLHIPNIKINLFMNQLFLLSFPLSQPDGYRQYQSQHTEVQVVFSSPVQSTGRAIVLTLASAFAFPSFA